MWLCPWRKPRAAACRLHDATEASGDHHGSGVGPVDLEALAALEGQLGGHLVPAGTDLAQHQLVGDEDLVQYHLVEVVGPGEQVDGADLDPRRVELDDPRVVE